MTRAPQLGALPLDRRQFLRAGATVIALPALEALAGPSTPAGGPRNFVAIGTYLGWHQHAFFPKQAGRDYELPPTLAPLAGLRDQFTVFSGLDHRAPNGHAAWNNFLCGMTPGSWSLDQRIADAIGQETRYPSIELTAGSGEGPQAMSFTRQGVGLPQIDRPSVLYKRLFASESDRARTDYLLASGVSALDVVLDDAKRLERSLPSRDRAKLDEYFESIRAVEKRMERQLAALDEPATTTTYKLPDYDPITPNLQIEAEGILYDLATLALESGQTRVITMFLHGLGQVFSLDGRQLVAGYHGLSHHGNDPVMIRDLIAIETAHVNCLARFLDQLARKKTPEGKTLLDDTIILLGTGMGDASRHSNANLPTLVAGGGFRHGSHVAVDPKEANAPLLGNLYITLMQRLGIEAGQFSNASRDMNEVFS
ncbi:MAG: DUF1552 domain-containing protein [Planctomycetia bacterium]|nr:DUF1552 domain-containing protein [Planctomycetia bacterium]